MTHSHVPSVNKADRFRVLAILEKSNHFRAFPRSFANRLISISRIVHCGDEKLICKLDEVPRHAWIVLGGALYYSNIDSDGAELIFGMIGPGSFVGLAVIVDEAGMHSDIRTRGTTELLQIPKAPLLRLLDRNPRMWKIIAGITANRLRILVEKVREMMHAPLEERVVWHLLSHAMHLRDGVGDSALSKLPISQAELAKIVGVSRTRLSSLLNRLQAQRLLRLDYRSITLLELDTLRRMIRRPVLSP